MDGADVCITLAHTYGAEREIGSAIAWAESAKPNAGIVLAFVDDAESLWNRIRAEKNGPAKEVPVECEKLQIERVRGACCCTTLGHQIESRNCLARRILSIKR
jgi:hypothetical protein